MNKSKSDITKKVPGYITANPLTYNKIKQFRTVLKNNPTKGEIILWEYLRNKKTGYKIRRQHIIDDFIADFVCIPLKLIIEIDGNVHLDKTESDLQRTIKLN